MIAAPAGGALLATGGIAFVVNLIWTLGWSNVRALVPPARHGEGELARG